MEMIRAVGKRVLSVACHGIESLAEMFHVSKRDPDEQQNIASAAYLREHLLVTKAEIINYLVSRGHEVVLVGVRWYPNSVGRESSDCVKNIDRNVVPCPPNSTEPDRIGQAILVRREREVTERLLFTCMTERPVQPHDIDAVAAMVGGREVVFIVEPNVNRIAEDAKSWYGRLGLIPDEI